MNLSTGHIIRNRYEIADTLGEGGFGQVYKARDLQFQQRFVAVKQRIPIDPNDIREKELFEREAQFLCTLRNSGIPEIFDYFPEQGFQFIVMQFIEGRSLEKLLSENSGILREVDAVPLMIEVLQILEYLHSQTSPVVHRDIKPENIVKSIGGSLYLVDFGTSRHFDTGKLKDTIRIGTCGYMAPEQFRGYSAPGSDIFSFGATFHHLLSGIDPRDKKESERYSFPLLGSINNTVSPELELLIDRCLQEKAEERIGTAAEILKILKGLSRNYDAAPSRQTKETSDPQFWFHQGKFHVDNGDYAKARECLVKSRKFGNNTEEVILLIARCHRMCGNRERAIGILKNLIESGPVREDTVTEYLKAIQEPGEAEKILQQYVLCQPQWLAVRMRWIEHLIKMKRVDEARQILEESLQASPDDLRFIQLKAAHLFGEKKIQEVQSFLDSLPAPICENPDILFRRGYARELQGNDAEAFTFYRMATERKGHGSAFLQMARILVKRGSLYEAREHYEKAVSLSKDPMAIKRELGLRLFDARFFDQSALLLKEVLQHFPDDTETLKHLGFALGELKEYEEAMSCLVRYSHLKPEDSSILLITGRYCLLADRREEAGVFVEKYCSLFPDDMKGIEMQRAIRGERGSDAS